MSDDFVKFPSTPHLAQLGALSLRGDKVMSAAEREEFLAHELIVEEKVDGANLGLSFDADGNLRAQNRGAYLHLPAAGQWRKLAHWLEPRTESLFEHLADRYILYGEWCYARHSVFYDRLPDWFLGFDLYDQQVGRFLDTQGRDGLLSAMQIARIPRLACGRFTLATLTQLLGKSQLGEQRAEGIYLRYERAGWLVQRAKLVVPAFVQAQEQHWSHAAIEPNSVLPEAFGSDGSPVF